MHQQDRGFFAGESGAVAVSVAVVLVVILGMTALAIDYGHIAPGEVPEP